jgi:hypothetical protein
VVFGVFRGRHPFERRGGVVELPVGLAGQAEAGRRAGFLYGELSVHGRVGGRQCPTRQGQRYGLRARAGRIGIEDVVRLAAVRGELCHTS